MMVSLDTQHSMFSFFCVMFYDLHISIRDMYLLFLVYLFSRLITVIDGVEDGYRRSRIG